MIKLFDRVKVNISTTGTGDITFGAAASTAFLTPTEAGVLDGDEVRYVIVDGLDFEEGVGLIKDTVATMERTVTKSKVGGTVGTSALNLSGTAVLALTASAADILTPDDNLASLKDPGTALNNLGGGAKGADVFKATDESDVLDALPSVYRLANVIGTVSYSGGNTGAVIESGSNSNGYYLKLANGTMIQWRIPGGTTTSRAITFSFGGGMYSLSTAASRTFPVAFAGAPTVIPIVRPSSSGRPYTVLLSASTTDVTFDMLNPGSLTADFYDGFIAVGPWR